MTVLDAVKKVLVRCKTRFYDNTTAEEKNELKEWYCDELKNFSGEEIFNAFMVWIGEPQNNRYPTPEDIKSIIRSSRKPKESSTEFNWLMNIDPHGAKYYGDRLEGNQRQQLLNRLRAHGIPDFVPLDECPGFKKYQAFIAQLETGKLGKFVRLEDIERSEYDDRGPIDPRAAKLIGERK